MAYQITAGVKFQHNLDGEVTALLSDQNFPAMVRSFAIPFAVLGAQVVDQIDPGSNDLAAAGALHRDLK